MVGDVSWNQAGTLLTFSPAAPLSNSTEYTLSFGAELLDAQGGPIPAPEALTFTTPPPIVNTRPRGREVLANSAVQITFDRLMDEDLTAAAFRISPAIEGDFVALPAEVSAMYNLSLWGRSASNRLSIDKAPPAGEETNF